MARRVPFPLRSIRSYIEHSMKLFVCGQLGREMGHATSLLARQGPSTAPRAGTGCCALTEACRRMCREYPSRLIRVALSLSSSIGYLGSASPRLRLSVPACQCRDHAVSRRVGSRHGGAERRTPAPGSPRRSRRGLPAYLLTASCLLHVWLRSACCLLAACFLSPSAPP